MKEQWDTIIESINTAADKLRLYGDESHAAAMAMDKLDEALFWATVAACEDEDGE